MFPDPSVFTIQPLTACRNIALPGERVASVGCGDGFALFAGVVVRPVDAPVSPLPDDVALSVELKEEEQILEGVGAGLHRARENKAAVRRLEDGIGRAARGTAQPVRPVV